MNKRAIVRWFVSLTHGWNREFHDEIEGRIQAEYKRMFPDGTPRGVDMGMQMETMRSFYYERMTTTANLLISAAAFLVSLIALLVSAVALFKS